MKTLIKKEFEIIEQGDAEGQLSSSQFKLLRDFVFDSEKSAPDFFKLVPKDGKEAIKVQNYVGVIELPDGFRIEVLPKIDLAQDDEKCDKTRCIFLKMLQYMDENQFKVSDFANLNTSKMPLFEIFIQMFLNDVQKLTRVGLKSGYVHIEENSKTFKGKLLVSQNIRENLVHQERFFVEYDEFQLNRPENRLVKSTLLYLNKKSNSDSNLAEIRRQLMFFEQVDASVNYEADFSKVVKTRNTTEYENLMAWARVFLQNKSFSTFSGSTSVRSILFPMEKVFEAYVAKKLRKAIACEGCWKDWSLYTQCKERCLFEEPEQFQLKPDIIMKKNDGSIIILDTKWKRLVNNESNYGISQQDMYQMYAYGHKYKCQNIWLIYPENKDVKWEIIPKYKEFKDRNDGLTVSIYYLNLEDKDAFSKLLSQLKEEK